MADSTTRLGFEITGNVSQGNKAVSDFKSHINSELGSVGSAAEKTFGDLKSHLNGVVGQLPVVGNAMQSLSANFSTMTAATEGAGAGLATLAAGAVVGAAGLGALATGCVLVAKEIWDATKSAAAFEGKLFDISQKTGFTVESLSALQILAKTTGGSIEGISGSLGLFQRNMENAAEGDKKLSKTFKDLNIDVHDNEKALRDAFTALSKLPEGAKQTATAMDLFGRSGKDVLAIVKETNGNLDEATAKFAAMGLIVSGEAAAAADKFNDTFEILSEQLSAVSRQLVSETVPVFIVAMEDISMAVSGNAQSWHSWSNVIATEVAFATGVLEGFVQWVASNFTLNLGSLIDSAVNSVLDRAHKIQGDIVAQAGMDRVNRATQAVLAGSRRSGGGGGGGGGARAKTPKDEAYKAELEASRETAKQEEEIQRHLNESLKQDYEENLVTLEEFYKQRQEQSDAHFATLIDEINRDQKAVDDARAKGIIKKEELDKEEAAIELRAEKVRNESAEADRKLALEKKKTIDKQSLDLENQLSNIRETMREGELDRIKDLEDREIISESEAISRRMDLEKDAQTDRVALIDIELAQLTTSAERKIELDNLKIDSEQKFTNETNRLTNERISAMEREAQAAFDKQNEGAKGATRERTVGPTAFNTANLDPLAEAMRNINAEFGTGSDKAVAFGAALGTVDFASRAVAQAVGEAVHAFVLFGSAGIGLRKFTAELIANIAQMAAVQAVWELAQGVAMLATNFFWPDPRLAASATAHFHAAAIYGGLAVLAAGAGRAVAGNAFASTGGGGGGSAGKPSGPPTANAAPGVRDVDRNASQPRLDIHITRDEGSIVKVIQSNYRAGGEVRDLIHHALGDPGFAG